MYFYVLYEQLLYSSVFLFRRLLVTPLGLEPRTPTLRTDSKTRTCDIIHLTISVISVNDFKVNRELFKCCALPSELRGQLKKTIPTR